MSPEESGATHTATPAPARFDRIDTLDPVDGTLAELAREHDAVVRAVFRSEPALPLRFGTVLDGEDAARRLLEAGAVGCNLEDSAGSTTLKDPVRHADWLAEVRTEAETRPETRRMRVPSGAPTGATTAASRAPAGPG